MSTRTWEKKVRSHTPPKTRSRALIYLRLSASIWRHLRLKKDLYPLQSQKI